MSMNLINILEVKGSNFITSEIKYPITPDTNIELKGDFCSSGKNKSKIYFGLRCFKENGDEIFACEINRVNEPLLITSISSDGKSLTLNKMPEKWNNSNEDDKKSLDNCKYLGIYYDGNTDGLADYIMHTPAYKKFNNNIIDLNKEIPNDIINKIIPYQTKIMNHYDNNYRDYSAACGVDVPEKWTEYKAEYKGFSNGFGDISGKFRAGTKSVCPFMVCNYRQNEEAILFIKNVEIVVKDKPKFVIG